MPMLPRDAHQLSSGLVTRRRLAALGAAAGTSAFLAACGAEAEDPAANDPELLNQQLAAELSVAAEGKDDAAAQAEQNIGDLTDAIEGLGATPVTEAADAGSAGAAEDNALSTALDIVGGLDDGELRQLLYGIVVGHSTLIAVARAESGEEIAPEAFVLGSAS